MQRALHKQEMLVLRIHICFLFSDNTSDTLADKIVSIRVWKALHKNLQCRRTGVIVQDSCKRQTTKIKNVRFPIKRPEIGTLFNLSHFWKSFRSPLHGRRFGRSEAMDGASARMANVESGRLVCNRNALKCQITADHGGGLLGLNSPLTSANAGRPMP